MTVFFNKKSRDKVTPKKMRDFKRALQILAAPSTSERPIFTSESPIADMAAYEGMTVEQFEAWLKEKP